VQLYASDILALDGDDLRCLPLSMRKTTLPDCWRGARMASSLPPSRKASSARPIPPHPKAASSTSP
jgi:ATP-dependent DNA ligase